MKEISSHISTSSVPLPKHPSSFAPFDFQPRTRVISGRGVLSKVGSLVRELSGSRVMLVTDPGILKTGHPDRALKHMRESGLETFVFSEVRENPDSRLIMDATDFARANKIDFVVALGGGSSMDCAKGVNFLLTNGGTMADYKGYGKAPQPMLPSIGIPTTSGTGSEAQSYALISEAKTQTKMACGDPKAAFRIAILDPELTVSQPKMVAAVTGIDAIAHALESFVSLRRNPWSNTLAKEAWGLLSGAFPVIFTDPENIEARWSMLWGAHLAGMAIENSMLGAAHASGNPFTAHYGITHGVAVSLMLPHVIRFNSDIAGDYYQELAGPRAEKGKGAEFLASEVDRLASIAGLPRRLRDVGISQSIFPILAEEAMQQWTGTFNPRPLTEDALIGLYELAW